MAFVTLENSAPPKTTVPKAGVAVSSRQAGRGDTKTSYIAIRIGVDAARSMALTTISPMQVFVKAGVGDDVGKIAIGPDTKGAFEAKRQKNGAWLVTLNRNAIGGRYATDFASFTIDAVRQIPAGGGNGPMIVIKCPEDMRAVG